MVSTAAYALAMFFVALSLVMNLRGPYRAAPPRRVWVTLAIAVALDLIGWILA